MNEKVAAAGNQVKDAFTKLGTSWKEQEPAKKKRLTIIGVGLLAAILALYIIVSTFNGRFIVIYPSMPRDEAVRALAVLETVQVPARINSENQLEVPANRANQAMGQLAIQGIPNTALDYSIFAQASGLSTTEFEKKQLAVFQLQDRLQSIIKTYSGVQDAFVTLNIADTSNRVWDAGRSANSASVKIVLEPGAVLTPAQVKGIRHLVGPAAGIDPNAVAVIDSSGVVLAASGQNFDEATTSSEQFLQRQGFEEQIEGRMYDKTANILSLPFPNAEDYRISITAVLDYDAMITESMQYQPLEGTNHGVISSEQIQAAMGLGQYAGGIAGEDQNTDIPTYVDLNGDGQPDMVDYSVSREFLVSYIKSQIEKDGAKLTEASIGIVIRVPLDNDTRQTLRELIAAANNLPIESITVQAMGEGGVIDGDDQGTQPNTILGLPALVIYIAIGVLVAILLIFILIAVLRSKARKKQLLLAKEAEAAEMAEQERIQQEIEERKRQLKDAAQADQSENAIVNEVREFAKTNPEITANLLRTWLKEGEG